MKFLATLQLLILSLRAHNSYSFSSIRGNVAHIGEECEENDECLSNLCTSLCDESMKICDKPEKFYQKKGETPPDCLETDYVKQTTREKPTSGGDEDSPTIEKKKYVGQTCNYHHQCESNLCSLICNKSLKICNKPEVYYMNLGFDVPSCIENADEIYDSIISTDYNPQIPAPLQGRDDSAIQKSFIGDVCQYHDQCVSNLCTVVCGKSIKLCDKPEKFYEKQRITPPTCIVEDGKDDETAENFNAASIYNEEPNTTTNDAVEEEQSENEIATNGLTTQESEDVAQVNSEPVGELVGDERTKYIGETCFSNEQCVSGQCKYMCNKPTQVCDKPEKYYTKLGVNVPECVEEVGNGPSLEEKTMLRKTGMKKHIGEVCYVHDQCLSSHCAAICSDPSIRACSLPMTFYTNLGHSIPECVGEKIMQRSVS